MSNIINYYKIIKDNLEQWHELRFIPVNNRQNDHNVKVKKIKTNIRNARVEIGRLLKGKKK